VVESPLGFLEVKKDVFAAYTDLQKSAEQKPDEKFQPQIKQDLRRLLKENKLCNKYSCVNPCLSAVELLVLFRFFGKRYSPGAARLQANPG
jgi:hypothetical protein